MTQNFAKNTPGTFSQDNEIPVLKYPVPESQEPINAGSNVKLTFRFQPEVIARRWEEKDDTFVPFPGTVLDDQGLEIPDVLGGVAWGVGIAVVDGTAVYRALRTQWIITEGTIPDDTLLNAYAADFTDSPEDDPDNWVKIADYPTDVVDRTIVVPKGSFYVLSWPFELGQGRELDDSGEPFQKMAPNKHFLFWEQVNTADDSVMGAYNVGFQYLAQKDTMFMAAYDMTFGAADLETLSPSIGTFTQNLGNTYWQLEVMKEGVYPLAHGAVFNVSVLDSAGNPYKDGISLVWNRTEVMMSAAETGAGTYSVTIQPTTTVVSQLHPLIIMISTADGQITHQVHTVSGMPLDQQDPPISNMEDWQEPYPDAPESVVTP